MLVKSYKTKILTPPKDDLISAIKNSIDKIEENSVVCISSKVVSINEGRCILIDSVESKDELIKEESDYFLPRDLVPGGWVMHTITNNILLPSAGIDASNSDGHYILWPKDPKKSAKELWSTLREIYNVNNLGIVLTDSHSIPLRRGVVGICLAYFGFEPLNDYREKEDLFGRKLKVSQTNVPDSLASTAVLEMGEGAERLPIVIVSDIREINFIQEEYKNDKLFSSYEVPMEEDLYSPILMSAPWQKS